MGAKQTKFEGSYLPSTPVTQCTSRLINMNFNNDINLDPRSPSGSRTRINLKYNDIDRNVQLATADMPESGSNNENSTLNILRKRFLKSFTYNISDPRSPSLNHNRTPLMFEETFEKSLSLDDTFADLFVESQLPNSLCKFEREKVAKDKHEQDADIEMPEEKVMIHVDLSAAPQTPTVLQQQIDPRSPSIGVERTPIIFTDDEVDETNEDIMLESILATLSLNLNNSGTSSVVSMGSQNLKNESQVVLVNKHLDRVRVSKKSSRKVKHLKTTRRPSQQNIYEDQENHIQMTPKLKVSQADKNDSIKGKRTPLSCVRNRNGIHARSRSVESSVKSIKTRLALTSYDDTSNPTENYKVPNLRIMQQDSQDSLKH